VKTVVLLGAVVLVLLNLLASVRVLRSDLTSLVQRAAWLLLVWLVPVVGAVLALQISTDSGIAAPKPQSGETGSQVWPPGIGPDEDGPSDGHSV
jgi:Phospholipase_D-nuclease N-terminal